MAYYSSATGVAGGILGLVSRRYGADRREKLGSTVEGSVVVAPAALNYHRFRRGT